MFRAIVKTKYFLTYIGLVTHLWTKFSCSPCVADEERGLLFTEKGEHMLLPVEGRGGMLVSWTNEQNGKSKETSLLPSLGEGRLSLWKYGVNRKKEPEFTYYY